MSKPFNLTELRNLILVKEGIRIITPSDCKRLSVEIRRTLNKNISETTLKRFFGFAHLKHQFSKFTLSTLYEYVHEEYDSLHVDLDLIEHTGAESNWDEVHKRATAITLLTLKTIRNRSGLPYEYTVSRKFAEHDFEDFLESKCTFTSLAAQPGLGKTILLSHLADRFVNSNSVYKKDTLLFIKAYNIFINSQLSLSLSDLFRTYLGISSSNNLSDFVSERYAATGDRLVIFMDGFAELELSKEGKKQLFESLMNFISQLDDNGSIKLVLSMRTGLWVRFLTNMRKCPVLAKKLFRGTNFNSVDNSNLPPFSEQEVTQLLSKIEVTENLEDPKLKSLLRLPIYIESYYRLKQEKPYFNSLPHITYYELTAEFIEEKIYKSNDLTEKRLFLKRIVQLTNYGKDGYSVPKTDVIIELSVFETAYSELLSDGVLVEERLDRYPYPIECVRFVHSHVFEYLLLIELIAKVQLRMNHAFFVNLLSEYKDHDIKFQLINWGIRYLIRSGDLESLPSVFMLDLSSSEKNELILFIAESLHYRYKNDDDTHSLIADHGVHKYLINQILQLDFMDPSYLITIDFLIQMTTEPDELLVYQSLLLMLDFLKIDDRQIQLRIAELQSLGTESAHKAAELAQALLSKMRDHKDEQKIVLDDFNKSVEQRAQSTNLLRPCETVYFCLGIFVSMLYQENMQAEAVAKFLLERQPQSALNENPFCALMLVIIAYVRCSCCKDLEEDDLEKRMLKLANGSSRAISCSTSFRLKMILVLQHKRRGLYKEALDQGKECLEYFKSNKMNLNALLIYNELICVLEYLKEFDQANNYRYDRLCFIEENNIPRGLFPVPAV